VADHVTHGGPAKGDDMGGMRRIGAAALALALVGGLGACGDDDDDGDTASDETTTTEGSDDETDTTEDSDSDTDIGDIDFDNLEECSAFATAYGSLSLIFLGGAFGAETGDFDAEETLDQMDAIADDAPRDVQNAIEDVVSTYQEVFDNLQDSGFELNDAFDFADPDFAEAIEPLNDPDFNEANNVVSEYLNELCTTG
jgi:hypothetical protein